MPTSRNVEAASSDQPSQLRISDPVPGDGISLKNRRLWGSVRGVSWTFALAGSLLTASGCLATRSWVSDQLRPITGQQERFETQLNNLHLERRLVLDSSAKPSFAFGSAALNGNGKREIDGFFDDLAGSSPNSG